MVKNGSDQSGYGTVKLTISQKWTDGSNSFLHAGANLGKPKINSMIFPWVWSKMGMVFSSWDCS